MTGRGWAALTLTAGLWLWSRLLGVGELLQVSLALGVLLVAASIWLRLRSRHLLVTRSLSESHIHRTDTVTIDITIRNRDAHPTAEISVSEQFPDSLGSYAVDVPALTFGEHHVAAAVQINKRGRYRLDALEAVLTDPFRIVRNRRHFSDPALLLVYPKVESLPVPNRAQPTSGGGHARRAPTSAGEDFYGVRDYRQGDDPRKIHWPSSARMDRLMVREEEVSIQDRITVLLDDRSVAHSEESFDWAADAAASVADLYFRMGFRVKLGRPGGPEISAARGSLHYARIMEALAVASLSPATEDKLLALARRAGADVLVMVSGEMGAATAAAAARIAGRYREMVVVFPPGLASPRRFAGSLRSAGVRVVSPHSSESLKDAWEASMGGFGGVAARLRMDSRAPEAANPPK